MNQKLAASAVKVSQSQISRRKIEGSEKFGILFLVLYQTMLGKVGLFKFLLFLLLCFWLLGKRREMFSYIFLSNSNILIILIVTHLDNFITYYDKVFCLFGFWFGVTHAMLGLKSECSQGLLLIRLWGSYIVPRMDSTQAHARPYPRYYLSCPI